MVVDSPPVTMTSLALRNPAPGMVSLLLTGSSVQSRAVSHCQSKCATTAPLGLLPQAGHCCGSWMSQLQASLVPSVIMKASPMSSNLNVQREVVKEHARMLILI